MNFDDIITSFAHSETVPVEAIRAALAAPSPFLGNVIPLLQRVATKTSSEDEEWALSVLVHVLGEIGDERVLLPLMRILALPSEEIEQLLGDTITESLVNVIISLIGNRSSVLEEALSDTTIYDFVRSALFEAWTYLALTERIPRERAKAFLSDYPLRIGLAARDFGWWSWAEAVAVLGFVEMSDFAREHLPRKVAGMSPFDAPAATFEDFEQQLSRTLADPDRWKSNPDYRPFTSTIEELSGWHGYSEKYRKERARRAAKRDEDALFDEPYVAANPYKDIGRNDPCPCGSGKKFKKCCLNKDGVALD